MESQRRNLIKLLGLSFMTPFKLLKASPFTETLLEKDSFQLFPLSVASGDPLDTGFVIWTKLAPTQINRDEDLFFEVSTDEFFKNTVMFGEINIDQVNSSNDHTAKVDLASIPGQGLEPDQFYYYRFIHNGISSRTGRGRTFPEAGTPTDKCRFAMVTCQDYSSGYFHAFDYIAEEEIDFVVHLGDFIYEYAKYPKVDDIVREVDLNGKKEAQNLSDLRHIYQTYRSDRALQKAMERHTWIITWDDHETGNNCYWDYEKNTLGLEDKHPLSKEDESTLRNFKLSAQKAWTEYVPCRAEFNPNVSHPHEALKIYRKFNYGDLFEIFVTDSRTYRTSPECGDDVEQCTKPTDSVDYELNRNTMLGSKQVNWLVDGLANSDAKWKVWANQTLLSRFALTNPVNGSPVNYLAGFDAWDGFQSERELILQSIAENNVDQFLVLTGDFHTYLASFLKKDYSKRNWDSENIVGFELMTPSVTSANFAKALTLYEQNKPASEGKPTLLDRAYGVLGRAYLKGGIWEKALDKKVKFFNPHFKDFGATYNGYAVVDMYRDRIRWEVYHLDVKASHYTEANRQLVRSKEYTPSKKTVRNI